MERIQELQVCNVYIHKNSYIDSIVYLQGYPNSQTDSATTNLVDYAEVDLATLD